MEHHVGHIIKEYFDKMPKAYSVQWLANRLHCDRTNVYNIFGRQSIDSLTILRLSLILNHNFFIDIANGIRSQITDTPPNIE